MCNKNVGEYYFLRRCYNYNLKSPSSMSSQVWRFFFFFFSQARARDITESKMILDTQRIGGGGAHTWSASERVLQKFMNRLSLAESSQFREETTLQIEMHFVFNFVFTFGSPSSSFLLHTPSFFARFLCHGLFFCPFQCLAFFWFSVPPWRAYFFLPVAECLKGVVPFRFSCLLKAALSTTTTTAATTTTYA